MEEAIVRVTDSASDGAHAALPIHMPLLAELVMRWPAASVYMPLLTEIPVAGLRCD